MSADDSEEKLLSRVVSFYHATLKQNEEALSYLKKRGLDDAELIDHFQLGFANRTLGEGENFDWDVPLFAGHRGAQFEPRLSGYACDSCTPSSLLLRFKASPPPPGVRIHEPTYCTVVGEVPQGGAAVHFAFCDHAKIGSFGA